MAVHRLLALSLTLASAPSFAADAPTTQSPHPAATEHLPLFITAPGDTDVLMVVMAITLAVAVVGFGILFLRLHTLPERVAHKGHKIQFEIVAILGLMALFTHMHIFWVAGLLLAFIDIPDFGGFLGRIAGSVERMAGVKPGAGAEDVPDLGKDADDAGHAGSESAPRKPPRIWPARRSSTMLEMLLCSMFTLLPDYLYRRYVQGKRFGKEITLYSVWFELRWGITGCLILTVLLITTVFYNHPSTTNVTRFFRTIPIVPETIGRVAEVNIAYNDTVKKGAPLFRLDSSKQEAAVESARRKVVEVDAQMPVARADVVKADGQLVQAKSAHQQAVDELETKQELYRRNPGNVAFREIERLQERVRGLLGAIPPRPPRSRASRSGSRRCCRPRRPAPRQPSRRHRSISTRP